MKMMSLRYSKVLLQPRLYLNKPIYTTHTAMCPTNKSPQPPTAKNDGPCSKGGNGAGSGTGLRREIKSGKVRLAFIPDEWFLFFHSKTGVTGPYIFGLVLANYCVSKEIFIMEHEYYLGLSWLIVMTCTVKLLGPSLAEGLDAGVDAIQAEFDNGRKAEINACEGLIKSAKDAQFRAEGQKLLMDAKKENIAMQLEAVYRDRYMLVHKTVKNRMDYHVKRHNAETRIHQKWMIDWIVGNVRKSITPDFEKRALDAAISDLATAATRT